MFTGMASRNRTVGERAQSQTTAIGLRRHYQWAMGFRATAQNPPRNPERAMQNPRISFDTNLLTPSLHLLDIVTTVDALTTPYQKL
ncbi:hypothetical protein SVAN01_11936 [Stagonosporopsis vannaccii]|nr:hypothetical protein SVAN01_11936 [Stagonosporopsis vannaccii]